MIEVFDEGDKIVKMKECIGDPRKSKTAFSAEPIRKLPMGHWYELRIDDVQCGFMTIMGVGLTAEDPGAFEGDLPARGKDYPESFVAGYQKSLYWNGVKISLPNDIFIDVLPRKMNRIGCLLDPKGNFCVYVDRIKVLTINPGSEGLQEIGDRQVWALVDMWGGAKQLTVLNSLPPTEEEEAAAAAAKQAKAGAATKQAEVKEEEAAAEGAAPAEGEAGADAENAEES